MTDLTPYSELAEVIERLPLLVRERRRALGISLREAARQIGISFTTVSRIESGDDLTAGSLAAILRWLDSRDLGGAA